MGKACETFLRTRSQIKVLLTSEGQGWSVTEPYDGGGGALSVGEWSTFSGEGSLASLSMGRNQKLFKMPPQNFKLC